MASGKLKLVARFSMKVAALCVAADGSEYDIGADRQIKLPRDAGAQNDPSVEFVKKAVVAWAAHDDLLWFAKQILESGENIKIESPTSDETLENILKRGRAAIAKAEAI